MINMFDFLFYCEFCYLNKDYIEIKGVFSFWFILYWYCFFKDVFVYFSLVDYKVIVFK